jgi:hypothetical protein
MLSTKKRKTGRLPSHTMWLERAKRDDRVGYSRYLRGPGGTIGSCSLMAKGLVQYVANFGARGIDIQIKNRFGVRFILPDKPGYATSPLGPTSGTA